MSPNIFFVLLFSFVVYIAGVLLTGRFYKWAYESEDILFEVGSSGRFSFSIVWFLSVPYFFAFIVIYYLFKGFVLLYEKFVEKV